MSWTIYNIFLIAIITAIYYLASCKMASDSRIRDVFQAYSLIILPFQLSALLFRLYGILDNFQVILTIFWCSVSFLYVILGLAVGRKVFRLFGLTLLISSVIKILVVDLWVLKFYGVAPWFFIMGGVLIATSFLYQKHKEVLTEKPDEKTLEVA